MPRKTEKEIHSHHSKWDKQEDGKDADQCALEMFSKSHILEIKISLSDY
jgi:hypothetical protein